MKKLAVAAALFMSSMAVSAHATIVGGSVTGGSAQAAGGTFVKLTPPLPNPFGPPDSVGDDNFQSPNLFGFDEVQDVVLASALAVDVGAGPIAAGTRVESHYIFFDPGPTLHMIGTVNFDGDVLGVETSLGALAASDFLGNAGVNYLNPTLRGLETGDSVTIGGARQINFDTVASSPGDYVRVLTAVPVSDVPEPGAWALMLAGFAGVGGLMRRARSMSASSFQP